MAAYKSLPRENNFKREKEIKIFFQTKTESTLCQQTYTKRNIKESSSGRREIKSERYLDLHKKKIRSARNGKYMNKYKNCKDN